MFSKSLFRQSGRANGTMWLVITLAVCFMLSCVMLISGNSSISDTKNAIEDTIIKSELKSSIEKRGLNYYDIADAALTHFDGVYVQSYTDAYTAALTAGAAEEQAAQAAASQAYAAAAGELQTTYYPQVLADMGYADGSDEAQEVQGIIFYVLNPMQEDGTYTFDDFYTALGETPQHYTDLLAGITGDLHAEERDKYAMENCAEFLAGSLVNESSVQKILDSLSDYGVTADQYDEFGFSDYANVKDMVESAIVEYRAKLDYELGSGAGGTDSESVREELRGEVTNSLLASLPQEVSDALEEVGQMDMYGTLVGSIFFKMAGLLLPIIYMIMTSNALIAGQVDSGSMAYILSTSTKRSTVTFTQSVFLVSSLLAMFALTAATSIVCLSIVDVETGLTWQKLLLINLGAFLVLFAMSGICFLASCWFDRSKYSMGIGGGLSMFFLVATMLGLFGSSIMPSIVRVKALNYFNYVSIITLFDPSSMLEGTTDYLWKLGILALLGLACYAVGAARFRRKDLPL